MKYILNIFILFPLLMYGQKEDRGGSIFINLIPYASMMTNGNGLMVGYSYQTSKRFVHSLSVGMLYNNSPSGAEVENFTVDGKPIREWSTEIDYTTHRPFTFNSFVNSIDFENLDALGIKHFKPGMSYRQNKFINYDCSYAIPIYKFKLRIGFGGQFGLTNSEETHVGFTGKIISYITGEEDEFWINFNIRAKYIYLGAVSKLDFDYPITSNLRIGLTGGVHYIFNTNFMEDIKIFYAGVSTRVGIQ